MTIKFKRNEGEPDCDAVARAFTQPYVRAGVTVEAFTNKGFGVEVGALVSQLKQLNDLKDSNICQKSDKSIDTDYPRARG